MAIFGTIDAKALANDVSVTNDSVVVETTGDFTDRGTDDFIQAGDILALDGVQYTVESVVSDTELKLTTAYAGSTGTISAADAIRRTAPKEVANLLINESKFPSGTQFIFVDDSEAALDENKIRGLKWPGWWLYRTYTDGDGNTRHKAECIAFANAAAADSGDYDNDNPAADVASAISISVQPANQSTFAPAGALDSFSDDGGTILAGEADGEYIGVAPSATSGDGEGAIFDITRDGSGEILGISSTSAGSGYAVNDTITIDGASIGGVSTTDDLTLTVTAVAEAAATFSVTASVGTGTLTYQWQVQTATATTKWTDISGATSASLALTGLLVADNGKKYRVKVGGSAGGEEVISNTATLTVTAA